MAVLSLADWPVMFPCSRGRRLSCSNVRDGGVYIDGTFGAGGYTQAILAPPMRNVIGIDRDQSAVAQRRGPGRGGRRPADAGRGAFLRARSRRARNSAMPPVDGVVLDLGVSSMQLDEAERGFSFRLDGPLDMRMGGEGAERRRRGGAGLRARSRRHHLPARRGAPFARASRAPSSPRASMRRSAPPRRWPTSSRAWSARKPDQIHPATRTFQALRIFVNDELAELAAALAAAERILKPAGGSWS